MADYKNVGLDPVGAPHAYEKQEVGKPSRNAAQPCAVYDDPYRGDELRDGWAFRVGTWNVDSLTGRLGELVEALAERWMDVLCVQETIWKGCGDEVAVSFGWGGVHRTVGVFRLHYPPLAPQKSRTNNDGVL